MPASQSDVSVNGPPKTARKTPNPAIETRLLTVGAQLYGPKTLRAFSTSPSSANRP